MVNADIAPSLVQDYSVLFKNAFIFIIFLGIMASFRYFCRSIFRILRGLFRTKKSETNNGLNQQVLNSLKDVQHSKPTPMSSHLQYENILREDILSRNMEPNEIIERINKLGPFSDTNHCNGLLSICTKCKQFIAARQLFLGMKKSDSKCKPDVVTYNIIINGLVLAEEMGISTKTEQIVEFFKEMKNRNITPNEVTYNTVIELYVSKGEMEKAWHYFTDMQDNNIKPDVITFTTLIKGIKNYETNDRLLRVLLPHIYRYIDEPNSKLDDVMFNTLIEICLKFYLDDIAENIVAKMKEVKLNPTTITYGIFIKAYGRRDMFEKAVEYYDRIGKEGLEATEITYGCMIDVCIGCKKLEKAEEIQMEMRAKQMPLNVVIISTMIKGYTKSRCFTKAFEFYKVMMDNAAHIEPNIIAINAILDCCVQCNKLDIMKQIFEDLIKNSESNKNYPQPDLITYSTLIKGLNKLDGMDNIMRVYKEMKNKHLQLDEVLFNCILDGFAKSRTCLNRIDQVNILLSDMNILGIKKSNITYSILIKLYSQERKYEQAIHLHDEMIALNILPGAIVYTCLMQACIKSKRIDKAIEFYEEMKSNNIELDTVAFQTIISGCIYNGRLEKAMVCVLEAHDNGICVDKDIYANLLKNMVNSISNHRQRIRDSRLIEKVYNSIRSHNILVKGDFLQQIYSYLYSSSSDQRKYIRKQ